MRTSTLLVLCVLGALFAGAFASFVNCGGSNDDLQISSLVVTPDPPKKGQNFTVHLVGDLKKTVSAGTVEVAVYYIGIKVFSHTYELCSFSDGDLACPLPAGAYDRTVEQTFPTGMPGGKYKGKVTAHDQDSNQIACISFDISLAPNPETELVDAEAPVLNDDIIEHVNSLGEWKAHRHAKFEGMTMRQARKLLGTKTDKAMTAASKVMLHAEAIPDSFDARTQWPSCVHAIRDQQQCGSCWAFGATEAFSDRLCIATNGAVNVVLSPEDLVSCDSNNYGCDGGYLDLAWEYMMNKGVPTDACVPYTAGTGIAPACTTTCADGSAAQRYKVKAGTIAQPADAASIQTLIMNSGPVEAAFNVYQDFFAYKSGVYSHKTGGLAGGHAIKVVGWGVDDKGVKYWICANSWGTSWGINGFFLIKRGNNECGIESNVVAGMPDV